MPKAAINMASKLQLYAELLPNLRWISLAASFPSPTDATTRLTLASDGITVEVAHHGELSRLALPARVAFGASNLMTPKFGDTTLTWRLEIAPKDQSNGLPLQRDTDLWSATELDTDYGVACRKCGASIVGEGVLEGWKDLPSENWAEMMEFWHCHKPDDHSHPDDTTGKADDTSLATRGYGASSAISAQKKVGLVDLTTLLFAETDCRSLRFSVSGFEEGSANRQDLGETKAPGLNIFCSSCREQLGFFNFRAAAVTLLKWQVSCKSKHGTLPGVEECLSAAIISTISRSGSSKSLICPMSTVGGNAAQAIHIWVLNSGIVYSSSLHSGRTPAIKLLYRLMDHGEAERLLEEITCDAQEINLPSEFIGQVILHLDSSNSLLPRSERVLKEWKVGLLQR
ncbi:ubiquitin-conjugating enzyme E2-binding protein [Podospora conica]|nr:ubiquitin-conjugating enzyme E2-binding protein [Schizothecium conicum]